MTDICKPEQNSSIRPITSVTQSPDGRYTLDSINSLITNFENTIVSTAFSENPLNILISTYGSETVYQSLEALNSMLIRIAAPILPNYPMINNRIESGLPITPVEYTEFITQFLYTPISLNREISTDYVRVVSQLDQFFTRNFTQSSMGSFCALAPNIFGALQGFFDTLEKFKDIINKIQNFNVANLLEQLKQNILRTLDQIIQKLKNAIENFSISNIIGNFQTFVNENILARVHELQTLALNFFSEENIQNLRNRIEGLINYAISLFRNPSLDEILYLIYRFCGFMGNLEEGLNAVRQPLDDFSRNYQRARTVIEATSGMNTARAVSEGAIRYDRPQRESGIRHGTAAETAAGNPPPLHPGRDDDIVPWNNGQGDSRITFRVSREAWDRVVRDVKIKIVDVQKEFGKRLIIISAYRSEQEQRQVWIDHAIKNNLVPRYSREDGGEERSRAEAGALLTDLMRRGVRNPLNEIAAYPGNSAHQLGTALDVNWRGGPGNNPGIHNRNEGEEFIRIAISKGFNGIGRYGLGDYKIIHVDTSSNRTWGRW
jgi:hypothetical protein